MIDDSHAIGKQFHLGEGVGGEEQGSVAVLENFGLEEAAEFGGGDGVEAARRLVEQQDARLVQQGTGEAEALDGAGGEGADLAAERFFQMKLLRERFDAPRGGGSREVIQAAEEEKILPAAQARVKTVVCAGVIAQLAADGAGGFCGVMAGDARVALGGKQEGGEDFQQRGFACAVGAQQGHGFAIANLQGDSRESQGGGGFKGLQEGAPAAARRGKIFFEVFDTDGRFGHEGFIAFPRGENNAPSGTMEGVAKLRVLPLE